jgi:hypothetical protein
MTIRRENQCVTIVCDQCGQYRKDVRWRPYNVAWAEACALGWTSPERKDTREIPSHFCPEHAEVSVSR